MFFKFASKSEKSFVSRRRFGRRNRKQGKHAPAGNIFTAKSFAFRRSIDSLLGAIAQRLGDRVSPRARPCLRAWSIQMECSVCRSACGLTRRDTNPASAEGSRALSRETRVVSNGRRLRAVLVGIRTTACSPDMLKHAIVRVKRRTRDLIVQTHRRRLKNVTAFAKITMYVLHNAYRYHALPHTLRASFLTGR